jgi:hypothetical protein
MSKTIATLQSRSFLNGLHMQCMTEIKNLTESSDPDTLDIRNQYDDFVLWYNHEGDAYKFVRKSEITEEKARLDHERDHTLSGMRGYVNSMLFHYDTKMVEAARRLMVSVERFYSLSHSSYDAETAAITSLIQDLNAQTADVARINLQGWISSLQTKNEAFNAMADQYLENLAGKPAYNVRQARAGVEKSMRTMFDCINALIVMKGEAAYTVYVTRLNALIKHYNDVYAEHLGRYEANKKHYDAEAKEGKEN